VVHDGHLRAAERRLRRRAGGPQGEGLLSPQDPEIHESPQDGERQPSPRKGPACLEVDESADGQRLDRFLEHRFAKLPHGLIHKLLRKRDITVNRSRARPDTRLAATDRIELWADLSRWRETPEDRLARVRGVRRSKAFRHGFRVLHEDDSLIVLDKPAGIVVHPGPGHHGGDTLLDLLRAHLPEHFARESEYRPGFVHRLDRGTSGVLVAAKTRDAARSLENAMRRGETRKVYLALVRGRPHPERGEIDLSLQRTTDARGITRHRACDVDSSRDGAKVRDALTRYEIERGYPRESLLRVELGTGRTHQIRVHLAGLDHALVGDGDYGSRELNRRFRERWGLARVFLHASELEIPHPRSGEPAVFSSALPVDLRRVLDGLDSGKGDDARSRRPRRRRGGS